MAASSTLTMWVFVPRVPPRVLLLAVALTAPAALLGALANLLVLGELAVLDVWPGPQDSSGTLQELTAFREHVQVLVVGLFAVLGLATFVVVQFAPDAKVALNLWATALMGLFALALVSAWTLGGTTSSMRIGTGTALWGIAWVLVALHLYAFLRALKPHHWVWTTMGVGVLAAALTLLMLVFGVFVPVEFIALAGFLLAALCSFVVVMTHREARMMGGFTAPAPDPGAAREGGSGRMPLVAGYMAIVFVLIGTAYQHHFAYRPSSGMGHFVLMALAFLVGVGGFGLLMWRTSRRTMLLFIPLAAFVPVILLSVQQQHSVLWAVAITQGLMLAAIPFLLQYLLESVPKVTRTVALAASLGPVLIIGAGASLVAQLSALEAFTPNLLLSLQFAAFFSAMLLALALPETLGPVDEEEEIEEYLEVARRVTQQGR